jgi:3-dehydroquinate synthetase
LNFGHTVGHALEAISGYGKYLHGEAISIGQIAAAELSARLSGLSPAELHRIRALFQAAGLPVEVNLSPARRQKLFAAMRLDKKISGGEIKFVLARRIGTAVWGQAVPDKEVSRLSNF